MLLRKSNARTLGALFGKNSSTSTEDSIPVERLKEKNLILMVSSFRESIFLDDEDSSSTYSMVDKGTPMVRKCPLVYREYPRVR